MVMSEWAEDKLLATEKLFSTTYLITSIASQNRNRRDIRVFKVPSLSWHDFSWEVKEYRKNSNRKSIGLILWYLIAASIGRVWDLAFRKISTNSAARWSWAFSALPITLFLIFRQRGSAIFATGGATGGHLLGLLANFVSKVPLYLEFQDPLMGSEMKRSDSNAKMISKLERLFICRSVRTVFVTNKAAQSSVARHPQLEQQITSIYPGAWKFLESSINTNVNERQDIDILHLGTLYGARNLDNFFLALDNLREAGTRNANRVRVKNLGDIYLENKIIYLDRSDFELLPAQQRSEALRRALDSDALLLIQHSDSRSNETIPYKTFDYLNLKKPIIGIINNPELKVLLNADSNYLANASSVESIQETLKRFLSEFDLKRERSATFVNDLDINKQFARIFE
jgi:hypothetical protein